MKTIKIKIDSLTTFIICYTICLEIFNVLAIFCSKQKTTRISKHVSEQKILSKNKEAKKSHQLTFCSPTLRHLQRCLN